MTSELDRINFNKVLMLRRCQRVLRLVGELHKKGYQGLRISTYLSSLNIWRLEIYLHPMAHGDSRLTALYGMMQFNGYFGWEDARTDTARELAKKFEKRFSSLCRSAKGRDWKYAGWYQELMGFLEADAERLPLSRSGSCHIVKFQPEGKRDMEALVGGWYYETSFPSPPAPSTFEPST